jgi:hypothetical protein
MERLIILLLLLTLYGCASQTTLVESEPCPGDTSLPRQLAGDFVPAEDETLLQAALGPPGKGGLCQGRVYQSRESTAIVLYRAWNSTNPNSRLGHWWAFSQPAGAVSHYRADYEVCYQWSPLDRLVRCRLKGGTKVVIGPGQSAVCSDYLSYPASAAKQLYLEEAATHVLDCVVYEGEFAWRELTGATE